MVAEVWKMGGVQLTPSTELIIVLLCARTHRTLPPPGQTLVGQGTCACHGGGTAKKGDILLFLAARASLAGQRYC
jgi:hypothetical protein